MLVGRQGWAATYKQREGLLELGDLLLGERIGLDGSVSNAPGWGRACGRRVLQGGVYVRGRAGGAGLHTMLSLGGGCEGEGVLGCWATMGWGGG